MTEKLTAWYCGEMKAEATVMYNRVIDYRYVPVNGCGELNRPGSERCWKCGTRKAERKSLLKGWPTTESVKANDEGNG